MLAAAVPREGAATAERLRAALERDLYPVTVSICIYEANPGVRDPLPESLWGPVNVAARAMYNTERPRRNHVVHAAQVGAFTDGHARRLTIVTRVECSSPR